MTHQLQAEHRFSVVIPTVNGRETLLAAAIESVKNQSFKPYEIIIERNYPAWQARNRGYQRATCEFIAFLDDDDLWLENHLQVLSDELKNADFAYTGYFVDEQNFPARPPTVAEHTIQNLAPTSCIGMRKTALESINGFRKLPFGQDYDLIMRSLESDMRVSASPMCTVAYNDGNHQRISNSKIQWHSRIWKMLYDRKIISS
jgi:glycosyltransferase involved in cell wall biosynthesis